jgi:8-oxo-dGTP diphosphatase
MKETTLCYLIKGENVLLAMKKRGLGVGKWNGIGGKVKKGESVKESAIREIKEEIDVEVVAEDLEEVGTLEFHYLHNPDWDSFSHVFKITRWAGDPVESEEMRPQWYRHEEIPFSEMWADDPHWLPLMLGGKKVKAEFLLSKDGSDLLDAKVEIVG